MNIVCISIDGLHNGMVGAMGNAWIQTPALDILAGRSLLFDRYFTDSMRIDAVFESFWGENALTTLPKRLDEMGIRTILLTDDDDVFHHASADFSGRHRLELPETVAAEVEETQFFQGFATVVDLIENRDGKKEDPFFFWAHFQGFRGVWDFPADYRQRCRDEEDPEPYAGTSVPNLDGEIDPDDLQAVMEAYAGGMSVLDDSLAGLLDWFDESRLAEDTILIFLSTRGFSLGEHGRIGADETLYGENIQLPLMIRFPDGFEAASRYDNLLTSKDFGDFLAAVSGVSEDRNALDSFRNLFRETTDPIRDFVSLGSSGGENALVTSEWFLRKTADRTELYVKPDDRWEVNDVADRCPEIVEELTAILEEG